MTLDADIYRAVRARLSELGHGEDYTWAQNVRAPETAEDFAREYVWVVLNSGMKSSVARGIMGRVWPQLMAGKPLFPVFKHVGKANAIAHVYCNRHDYLASFRVEAPADPIAWCESLPWIGKITKYHLAKNLGVDVAKPDRWLVRLAAAENTTVNELCASLARETGDRIATVDVVLWRACAIGVLTVCDGRIETYLAAP